jgi:hypothetical protein
MNIPNKQCQCRRTDYWSGHVFDTINTDKYMGISILAWLFSRDPHIGPRRSRGPINHDYRVKMNVIDYITITCNQKKSLITDYIRLNEKM